jgi:HTH-type transcriptional regulator / antitoxin HigA
MEIRPIRSEEDHREALTEIERLWGATEGTVDGDKLDVLVTLVDAYEDRQWPIQDVSPLEILHHAVTDMGRSQDELAQLLGSRSRASEVLKGRRRLTVQMINAISSAWRIPADLLVRPYPLHAGRPGSPRSQSPAESSSMRRKAVHR